MKEALTAKELIWAKQIFGIFALLMQWSRNLKGLTPDQRDAAIASMTEAIQIEVERIK